MGQDEVGARVHYSTFKAVGIETADKLYTNTHTHTHTHSCAQAHTLSTQANMNM